ncbi:hypothetical protein AAG906_009342 [Vitis piasezkii]
MKVHQTKDGNVNHCFWSSVQIFDFKRNLIHFDSLNEVLKTSRVMHLVEFEDKLQSLLWSLLELRQLKIG